MGTGPRWRWAHDRGGPTIEVGPPMEAEVSPSLHVETLLSPSLQCFFLFVHFTRSVGRQVRWRQWRCMPGQVRE